MMKLLMVAVVLCGLYIAKNFTVHRETRQDLNLEKDFKEKKHLFYETCSVCGKKLKHARFGKTGDIMICSVECRGKTTWYCEDCGEKHLNNTPSVSPEDYIGAAE